MVLGPLGLGSMLFQPDSIWFPISRASQIVLGILVTGYFGFHDYGLVALKF